MRHFILGNASRNTNSNLKGGRRARISVESLEGRRLMDAGGSASLTVTAQVDVQVTASQQASVAATFNQINTTIAAQQQKAISTLKASEQQLNVVIGREALMIQQSGQAGSSAAVAVHARVMAEAKADLGKVQATEVVVINASIAARARAQQEMVAALNFAAKASATAKQELASAIAGATSAANSLHAQVTQGISAAGRLAVQGQAEANASVQGMAGTVTSTGAWAKQELTTMVMLDASLLVDGGVALKQGGSGGAGSTSH